MSDIVFRTAYDRCRIISSAGERYQPVYELDPDGDNEFDIRVSPKKHDMQAYIESFRDSCDTNKLIERFRNGDITAIQPAPNYGGDISGMPDNIQALAKNLNLAYDYYNSLSDDVKSQFTGVQDFYSSIGSDKFVNAFKPKEVPVTSTTEAQSVTE